MEKGQKALMPRYKKGLAGTDLLAFFFLGASDDVPDYTIFRLARETFTKAFPTVKNIAIK